MSIADFLFGRPIASTDDEQQKVGLAQGIPAFGLDALSSAAYGPEAALTVLIPAGLAGLTYVLPLTGAIILLLTLVYFSYRQTIAAYPHGGGSYTVAKENLGVHAGLFAASALMIDYVLNVAVGISAGVGAIVSAIPVLQPWTLTLCLVILAILTIVNLRGVREAGAIFMAPTYLFIVCMFTMLGWGLLRHGHAVIPPPQAAKATEAVTLWLLLRAFASGCTAMTGVEAVSNGVQAFQEPTAVTARRTLTVIIAVLIAFLAGISFLCREYHITATAPGGSGYQSILSMLTAAVAGRGVFYYVTITSILAVLCFSANTSFNDFPRICRIIAGDGYLPRSFANRGRRLVFTEGIVVLTVLSAILLTIFGGVTDRLIPLFAVGAFLAFTLSQAGMVMHWKKQGKGGMNMLVNGLGALATGITICVVIAAKFVEGAWVVILLVPALVALMLAVNRHYRNVAKQIAPKAELQPRRTGKPIVVVPMESWVTVTQNALNFALTLSEDVCVVHVECEGTDELRKGWHSQVEEPTAAAGLPVPRLEVLKSPYRLVIQPIIDFVLRIERENPGRTVAVVIPDLVERHWYEYFLHNQRGELLSAMLLMKGERRIAIINVPWYLNY